MPQILLLAYLLIHEGDSVRGIPIGAFLRGLSDEFLDMMNIPRVFGVRYQVFTIMSVQAECPTPCPPVDTCIFPRLGGRWTRSRGRQAFAADEALNPARGGGSPSYSRQPYSVPRWLLLGPRRTPQRFELEPKEALKLLKLESLAWKLTVGRTDYRPPCSGSQGSEPPWSLLGFWRATRSPRCYLLPGNWAGWLMDLRHAPYPVRDTIALQPYARSEVRACVAPRGLVSTY